MRKVEPLLASGEEPRHIHRVLQGIPRELFEIYEATPASIDDTEHDTALGIMQWMNLAARPLSLTELRYVVCLKDLETLTTATELEESNHWCSNDEVMQGRLLRYCGGLVKIVGPDPEQVPNT
jgi:hypothetical protein